MNIVFSEWDLSFELDTKIPSSIVVENCKLFEKMMESLLDVSSGTSDKVFLYKDAEIESLHKVMTLITSPRDFEYTQRAIQKKLLEEVVADFEISEVDVEIAELYGRMVSLIDSTIVGSDYNLEFEELSSLGEMLKTFDISLKRPAGTFVEKAIEYFSTTHRLLGKTVFVLANCDAYIDKDEYRMLCEWSEAEEICLLFLRSRPEDYEINVNTYIIDNDICIIR